MHEQTYVAELWTIQRANYSRSVRWHIELNPAENGPFKVAPRLEQRSPQPTARWWCAARSGAAAAGSRSHLRTHASWARGGPALPLASQLASRLLPDGIFNGLLLKTHIAKMFSFSSEIQQMFQNSWEYGYLGITLNYHPPWKNLQTSGFQYHENLINVCKCSF